MELFDQIRRISFIFFVSLGLIHFFSGMFFVNGYLVPQSGLVNRVTFIPFAITTLAYAFSNMKYHLLKINKTNRGLDYFFIGSMIVVLLGLLALELLAPDSPTPLFKSA